MKLLLLAFVFCFSLSAQFGPVLGSAGAKAYGVSIPTQVQKKTYASSSSSTTHNVVFDAAPINGNLLILTVVSNTTATTPSGWTLAASAIDRTGTYVYYKTAGASESATVAITISASDSCLLTAFEYSGMAASSQLDKTATAVDEGVGDVINTGTTATTAQASELLIAVVGLSAPGQPTSNVTGWNNSFVTESTLHSSGSADVASGTASKIVSATGAYSAQAAFINPGAELNQSGIIATFKGQ